MAMTILVPTAMDRIELQQVGGSGHVAATVIDLNDGETRPPQRARKTRRPMRQKPLMPIFITTDGREHLIHQLYLIDQVFRSA